MNKPSKIIKKYVKEHHNAYLYNCLRRDVQFTGDTYLCKLVEGTVYKCALLFGKDSLEYKHIMDHFGVEE